MFHLLGSCKSKGVRRLGGKGGLSGKQQLFKLKSFGASTAGEIPPDNIIIESGLTFVKLSRGVRVTDDVCAPCRRQLQGAVLSSVTLPAAVWPLAPSSQRPPVVLQISSAVGHIADRVSD